MRLALAALLLTGCAAFRGRPTPCAVMGLRSENRHVLGATAGAALKWRTGAEVRATWDPTWAADDLGQGGPFTVQPGARVGQNPYLARGGVEAVIPLDAPCCCEDGCCAP